MSKAAYVFFAMLLAALGTMRSAQAVSLMTVDAKRNCLDVNNGGYPAGGGPVTLTGLAKGTYVIEVKSSTVHFNCPTDPCPASEAVVWYGSRVTGSETWYQTVRVGQPVVIDYNPEDGASGYKLQAFILDTFCTNNTGSTILSVRQVAP
jgi:hypothetical protein